MQKAQASMEYLLLIGGIVLVAAIIIGMLVETTTTVGNEVKNRISSTCIQDLQCNDSNPCTQDYCENSAGTCAFAKLPDGTNCGTNQTCDNGTCITAQTCGNNSREGSEVCDGTDLAGQTCTTQVPGSSGTLACNSNCLSFNTSQCIIARNDYLGMSLPANFQVFSPSSPWNTQIGENPQIHPNSNQMIQTLNTALQLLGYSQNLGVNYYQWTSPIHLIDSTISPRLDLTSTNMNGLPSEIYESVDQDNDGIAEGIPMPEEIWPDPSADGHMILVDPNTREMWEFSRAVKNSPTDWSVSVIDYWSLDGLGYREPWTGRNWWRAGSRGSGAPFIAGLLRIEQIEAGTINNALAVSLPTTRKKTNVSNPWDYELCSPVSSRTDGQQIGSEFIPEGARIQLNPSYDISHLRPKAQVIARALQEYGAFVVDSSPSFVIYAQNLDTSRDTTPWNAYRTELADVYTIPASQFRVLDCDLKTH